MIQSPPFLSLPSPPFTGMTVPWVLYDILVVQLFNGVDGPVEEAHLVVAPGKVLSSEVVFAKPCHRSYSVQKCRCAKSEDKPTQTTILCIRVTVVDYVDVMVVLCTGTRWFQHNI